MLKENQVKLLTLLDNYVSNCQECNLYNGGRSKPYWTLNSKYCVFAEAPGLQETKQNTPLVGTAGNNFWNIMNGFGYNKEDFLVINSVNCRPIINGKNGKPSPEEMAKCIQWIRKYLKIIMPRVILSLGGYAIKSLEMLSNTNILVENSIIKTNSSICDINIGFNTKVICSVHPAYATIYNPDVGMEMLKKAVGTFNLVSLGMN